jgi:hypothetical protein
VRRGRSGYAGGLVRRVRHLVRDARGQGVTEYIAVAGMLVITGLLLSGILGRGLRAFVQGAVLNVRTIAP